MEQPILQVALDFLELSRALKCAEEAVRGGATWIEAGTPLIKSEGLDSIRSLRKKFPKHFIIADLKTMDAGRAEMEASAKAGANAATVMGAASESTILECIEAGRNYGLNIIVDLLGVADPVVLAKLCEEWGAHHLSIHIPIDDQMRGSADPLAELKRIRASVKMPISIAGGINSETAGECVAAGADIVIVGGAITKSANAEDATRTILTAMRSKTKIATTLYKRGGAAEIRNILRQVSTPNISDAMHRSGDIPGILPIQSNTRIVGPSFTVRTYPGDWAKPVEAIEFAKEGDVIIIDAGGAMPAVWGELASESCLQRRIAGVVIDGAIRDVDAIRQIGFQAFAKFITPTAGEPKGFGEMGVTIKVSGVTVSPGDWIVGDDSGLVIIPKQKAVEVANRAMDVLEKENRLREEIRRNSTLSKVTELIKWEKQIAEGK
ncbi:MAG: bifunctional hexulose-6-phosphate synthase/ribonuclease regulator [Planctomycetes bacterium RBG_16_43_13]|nr:MAG: bifunctional hexulose-6-phosphate synthase/ribonuclease regulator [Planctomycetes bacterium RBG_16_43_13]